MQDEKSNIRASLPSKKRFFKLKKMKDEIHRKNNTTWLHSHAKPQMQPQNFRDKRRKSHPNEDEDDILEFTYEHEIDDFFDIGENVKYGSKKLERNTVGLNDNDDNMISGGDIPMYDDDEVYTINDEFCSDLFSLWGERVNEFTEEFQYEYAERYGRYGKFPYSPSRIINSRRVRMNRSRRTYPERIEIERRDGIKFYSQKKKDIEKWRKIRKKIDVENYDKKVNDNKEKLRRRRNIEEEKIEM